MRSHESIHQRLNRLLVELSAQRAAAGRGDEHAGAWIAGVDHWLSLHKTGETTPDLIIPLDLVPLLADYTAVVEFEEGYRFAARVNAADSPTVDAV